MEKYFYADESPVYANKYIIRIDHEKVPFPNGTKGSFNVFPSRILNLSYADYLRYARDRLGAELIGKGTRYVIPYFEKDRNLTALIRLLNKRMEYIMSERMDPYEYVMEEDGNIKRIPFNSDENNERELETI